MALAIQWVLLPGAAFLAAGLGADPEARLRAAVADAGAPATNGGFTLLGELQRL